jgi:hypothetical protein
LSTAPCAPAQTEDSTESAAPSPTTRISLIFIAFLHPKLKTASSLGYIVAANGLLFNKKNKVTIRNVDELYNPLSVGRLRRLRIQYERR